ncbi:2-methoxy-6-polyprenyl-1,4-benzoquinol methylase, mitochondrial isoform X2 [Planococcus citri]|uniref:2-methoxy-6-polyprenyl-1,4-benzoquinol methylase, mitochondrial isoform X2 n=1 Tax=Planococcus citri TaxID=170843 RepID=UPI0031F88294
MFTSIRTLRSQNLRSAFNLCSYSNQSHNAATERTHQTHFGYEMVDENIKTEKVREVFEKVADSYDKMNDAMSLGIHRVWKNAFMQRLNPPHGTDLLDVAGGSGDIAFRFIDYLKHQPNSENKSSHVTVCDINEAMLKVGQKRAKKLGYTDDNQIKWIQGNAENLPIDSESVSAYTISFGIRNVTHIDKALEEAYRVLKPGGRFLCLEFSHVNNEFLRNFIRAESTIRIHSALSQ